MLVDGDYLVGYCTHSDHDYQSETMVENNQNRS